MGLGGKNRQSTRRRPSIPHHSRARLRRYVKRCTWSSVEVLIGGEQLRELNSISWDLKVDPDVESRFAAFCELKESTEKAINDLLLSEAQMLGLPPAMAPRRVFDVVSTLGPVRCSCAAAVLGDRNTKPDVLACTLPDGHADWHLDASGSRWRLDHGNLIVQPAATPESFTAEVQVKA